jgi:hypothetical protein
VVRITDETLPILCFQSYGRSSQADVDIVRPYYQRAIRRGKFIALSDARFANHEADQRRLWAGWLAELIRMDQPCHSVATVIMLDSPLLRGALIALNWITPSRAPQHIVANADEAVEECRLLCASHALAVPPHVWGRVRLWLEAGNRHRASE